MNRRSAVASTRVAFNTYWIPTLGPRRRGDACIVQNEDGYLKCAVTDQELHATTQEICALYRANRPHGSNNGINYRIPSRLQCADQAGSLWRIGRTGRSTLCCSSAPHQSKTLQRYKVDKTSKASPFPSAGHESRRLSSSYRLSTDCRS